MIEYKNRATGVNDVNVEKDFFEIIFDLHLIYNLNMVWKLFFLFLCQYVPLYDRIGLDTSVFYPDN